MGMAIVLSWLLIGMLSLPLIRQPDRRCTSTTKGSVASWKPGSSWDGGIPRRLPSYAIIHSDSVVAVPSANPEIQQPTAFTTVASLMAVMVGVPTAASGNAALLPRRSDP